MASINNVTLLGHLGADPEIRYMPDGTATATVSIATSEAWKDKAGERQERTEWHRVVFYSRLAEVIRDHLKRGSQVHVTGKLRTRKWTDKTNVDHYVTEINARELVMLGKKAANEVPGAPANPSSPEPGPADDSDAIPF